jgi:hypothetical protein
VQHTNKNSSYNTKYGLLSYFSYQNETSVWTRLMTWIRRRPMMANVNNQPLVTHFNSIDKPSANRIVSIHQRSNIASFWCQLPAYFGWNSAVKDRWQIDNVSPNRQCGTQRGGAREEVHRIIMIRTTVLYEYFMIDLVSASSSPWLLIEIERRTAILHHPSWCRRGAKFRWKMWKAKGICTPRRYRFRFL